MIFLCDCLNIIFTFQLLLKLHQFFRYRLEKRSFSFRVFHVIISLQHGNFKHKTVFRLINTFLKLLGPKGFDKFIRVFIRIHMQHSCPESCTFYDRYRTQCGTHTGIVTVVRQDYFVRITFQKCGMLLRQSRSKRCHCI